MQQLLRRMAAFGDAHYDPGWGLLKLPAYRNVHTDYLPPGDRHLVRESGYYALVLLERAGEGDAARAEEILRAMEKLQTRQEGHPRDGLWHYFAEESVMDWPMPDFNWADFNGLALLLIWHLKRSMLAETARDSVREMIRRAADSIRRRNVTMAYTNIAIKGTFVTLAAAELLEDADLLAYATDRAQRLHQEIFRTGSFAEYNSPTYAAVSIGGLMAIDRFVRHERSRTLAREIQHLFWRHIASHVHVPTGELAGPHSRAYFVRLNEGPPLLTPMLAKASGGRIRLHIPDDPAAVGLDPIYGYFLNPDVPDDAARLLIDDQRIQRVIETTDARSTIGAWWRPVPPPDTRDGSAPVQRAVPTRITTWIHPAFCLGSVNLQDGWEQRQNLIGYWNGGGTKTPLKETSPAKTSYLLHRYLHDERPCCSGYFASAQREGTVLATSFLVEYCDTHLSVPADEITAEFLGVSVQINNEGQPMELWVEGASIRPGATRTWGEGEHLWLRLPAVWMALRLLRHHAEPASNITPALAFDGSRLELRLPHYQGPRKRLRWTDLRSTHTSYGLWMTAPQADWEQWQASVRRERGEVRTGSGEGIDVSLGDLRLTVPGTTVSRPRLPLIVSA